MIVVIITKLYVVTYIYIYYTLSCKNNEKKKPLSLEIISPRLRAFKVIKSVSDAHQIVGCSHDVQIYFII